jgi:hypothetical protein
VTPVDTVHVFTPSTNRTCETEEASRTILEHSQIIPTSTMRITRNQRNCRNWEEQENLRAAIAFVYKNIYLKA